MKDTVSYILIISIPQKQKSNSMTQENKFFLSLNVVCTAVLLSACSGNATPKDAVQQNLTGSDKRLYEEALGDVGENNAAALEKLDLLELTHPNSSNLPEAMTLKLYVLYSSGRFEEAIAQADKFISLYPNNKSTPYAYYIKGMARHGMMMDTQRDQQNTQDAADAFDELARRFPDSEFVQSSRQIADHADNMLAMKQIEIGRFYAKNGQYGPAAERYQSVLKNYRNSVAAPEAMYRMVEVHNNLNSPQNAENYYRMLQQNHPNNVWTEKATKIVKITRFSGNSSQKMKTKELVIPGDETGFYDN